jgi:hypothetical protein
MSDLLKALAMGGSTLGAGAAIHGAGLGQILQPLDWPRQAAYNLFAAPYRALETGDPSELLGAIPGASGAILGGAVGGPLGVLAGSILGGGLQGAGQATGFEQFNAPTVEDLSGTDEFIPNFLLGALTDPLTYAGGSAAWRAARPAGNALVRDVEEGAGLAGKSGSWPIGQAMAKKKGKPSPENLLGDAEKIPIVKSQKQGGSTVHSLLLDGEDIGGMDLQNPSVKSMEKNAADRMFPGVVKPEDTISRIFGVEIAEPHRGKGYGQKLYLDAMNNHGSDWYYNSQTEPGATNVYKALEKKGLIEIHWSQKRGDGSPNWDEAGGIHLVRLTDAGRAAAKSGTIPKSMTGIRTKYVPKEELGGTDDDFMLRGKQMRSGDVYGPLKGKMPEKPILKPGVYESDFANRPKEVALPTGQPEIRSDPIHEMGIADDHQDALVRIMAGESEPYKDMARLSGPNLPGFELGMSDADYTKLREVYRLANESAGREAGQFSAEMHKKYGFNAMDHLDKMTPQERAISDSLNNRLSAISEHQSLIYFVKDSASVDEKVLSQWLNQGWRTTGQGFHYFSPEEYRILTEQASRRGIVRNHSGIWEPMDIHHTYGYPDIFLDEDVANMSKLLPLAGGGSALAAAILGGGQQA